MVTSCHEATRGMANVNMSARIMAVIWACFLICAIYERVIVNLKMFATKSAHKPEAILS
jgi:hypothetical protein